MRVGKASVTSPCRIGRVASAIPARAHSADACSIAQDSAALDSAAGDAS
jgi:hypothetical protein